MLGRSVPSWMTSELAVGSSVGNELCSAFLPPALSGRVSDRRWWPWRRERGWAVAVWGVTNDSALTPSQQGIRLTVWIVRVQSYLAASLMPPNSFLSENVNLPREIGWLNPGDCLNKIFKQQGISPCPLVHKKCFVCTAEEGRSAPWFPL